MSEKVKITREIAEAIEKLRDYDVTDFGIIANIIKDIDGPLELKKPIETLRNFTHRCEGSNADKLLDALRIGHEVEEEFKEGDWVFCPTINHVARVIDPHSKGGISVADRNYARYIECRHATEQEIAQEKKRRFWSGIGREVDEYREGDVFRVINIPQEIVISEIKEVRQLVVEDADGDCWNVEEIKLVTPVEQRCDT